MKGWYIWIGNLLIPIEDLLGTLGLLMMGLVLLLIPVIGWIVLYLEVRWFLSRPEGYWQSPEGRQMKFGLAMAITTLGFCLGLLITKAWLFAWLAFGTTAFWFMSSFLSAFYSKD